MSHNKMRHLFLCLFVGDFSIFPLLSRAFRVQVCHVIFYFVRKSNVKNLNWTFSFMLSRCFFFVCSPKVNSMHYIHFGWDWFWLAYFFRFHLIAVGIFFPSSNQKGEMKAKISFWESCIRKSESETESERNGNKSGPRDMTMEPENKRAEQENFMAL